MRKTVILFELLNNPNISWTKLFSLSEKYFDKINPTRAMDDVGKPKDNNLTILNAVENLREEYTAFNDSIADKLLWRHLHYSFLFIIEDLMVKELLLLTELTISSYQYQDSHFEYGLISGNLLQWQRSIILLCDRLPELGNGMYTIFKMIGLSDIFKDYEAVRFDSKTELFSLKLRT